MPNVMAALPNIGGALCSTPRSAPCNDAVDIGERKTWTQSVFYLQNSVTAQEPPKMNIAYSVPAKETAKDRAKFCWPPVSDVAVVTKPIRETH